ncbi:hypothetical protein THASP1DRAFT_23960, partial [Thamnocephalis sphaerospora]
MTQPATRKPVLSCRLVHIDHYCTIPSPLDVPARLSLDEYRSVRSVPLVRLFGTCADGRRVCVHVHQALPYLFLPYDGPRDRLYATLDPGQVSRAAELLRGGSVLRTPFHVYESHIPYTLQFIADFGMYGMGWIHLA